MIILQKKKILLCIGLITVSMLFSGIYININNKRTIPTISFPVTNKVIILDARSWYTR